MQFDDDDDDDDESNVESENQGELLEEERGEDCHIPDNTDDPQPGPSRLNEDSEDENEDATEEQWVCAYYNESYLEDGSDV